MKVKNKPDWLKIRPQINDPVADQKFFELRHSLKELGLTTVCQESACPNQRECFERGVTTIMIMGDTCTRACRFCATKTAQKPRPLDLDEPARVSRQLSKMNLKYVVLTSVDRDDLADLGADHFAKNIRAIKALADAPQVEVLIPDFQGRTELLDLVIQVKPRVMAHNLETVERLTPQVRDPRATYTQSLEVLRYCVSQGITTKSSLMVGLGEEILEIEQVLRDLREVGVEIVTLGQYLQPNERCLPVQEYITPDQFQKYQDLAFKLGIKSVMSGPLVRSSYRAETLAVV